MSEVAPRPVRGRRVFIGLIETAGVAAGLAEGFAELGWRPSVVLTHEHPFAYSQPHERHRWLTSVIRWLCTALPGPLGRLGRVASVPLRIVLLVIAVCRNDVFVFLSRTRFVSYRELRLLRLLGKRVVHIFLGSDIRPPYMDGNLMRPSWHVSPEQGRALLADTRAAVAEIEKHSEVLISMPLYAQLLTRPNVHCQVIGLPLRELPGERAEVRPPDRPAPVVMHSPSSPEVKGTELVRAAVAELRARGLDFEYRELSGVPNEQVLAALRDCDLVVDQCYSDTPLAMFATEAAKLARPVIVGGYGWEELARSVPEEFMAPSILCAPEDLTEVLARWLTDPAGRVERGRALATYVERLRPALVAQRLLDCVEGRAPASWYFDPREVDYRLGCGMSRERAAEARREVLGDG